MLKRELALAARRRRGRKLSAEEVQKIERQQEREAKQRQEAIRRRDQQAEAFASFLDQHLGDAVAQFIELARADWNVLSDALEALERRRGIIRDRRGRTT